MTGGQSVVKPPPATLFDDVLTATVRYSALSRNETMWFVDVRLPHTTFRLTFNIDDPRRRHHAHHALRALHATYDAQDRLPDVIRGLDVIGQVVPIKLRIDSTPRVLVDLVAAEDPS